MAADYDPLRRALVRVLGLGAAGLVAGCSGVDLGSLAPNSPAGPASAPGTAPPPGGPAPAAAPAAPASGSRIGLVLPLSAGGNAGAAAQSMKNAADMALAEFNNPDVQFVVKDDAGTTQGAQQAAQQAIEEGASVLLGPLFAHAVGPAAQVARARSVPVIAFSTDSNVAGRGVYLLSFLPESDVERIVDYAVEQGKHAFAALVADNAYGGVVEAAFKQTIARKGGRVVAVARYKGGDSGLQAAVQQIAQAAGGADALFIPDTGDSVPRVAQALAAAGVDTKRVQLLGTGLWDDSRVLSDPALDGGWFAAPDSAGFRAFAARYRSRYGQDPVRTATLAYDAVALVSALMKAQPGQRISDAVLTNPSGFAGIDGVFRFRSDGTNQRGLAVMKISSAGAQVVSAAPKSFG